MLVPLAEIAPDLRLGRTLGRIAAMPRPRSANAGIDPLVSRRRERTMAEGDRDTERSLNHG